MAEIALRREPLLPALPLMVPAGDVTVTAGPDGFVGQVLAAPNAAPPTDQIGAFPDMSVRGAGPGQWYLVGETPRTPADVHRMAVSLGADLTLIDQSHGRVRLVMEGPGARRMLALGTAVDLADSAFPVGHATSTLYGHVGVHLTRTATDTFELLVTRSFALDLWESLASP